MSVFSALLNNGPLQVGPLADRGAFDQYAQYRPGQIVVDGGVTYLNIAAIGAAPELEDTFDRREQQGWGQSSHGEVWQSSDAFSSHGPPAISGGRGVLAALGGYLPDGQLLGPAALHGSSELLIRLALPWPAAEGTAGLDIMPTATEDEANLAKVALVIADDGTTTLKLQTYLATDLDVESSTLAGPSVADGQECWVRVRRLSTVYSVTMWPVGVAEPDAPQVSLSGAAVQPSGHVALLPTNIPDGAGFSVGYLSLRPLTAATVPGDDTEHWVALADALQVPQPL